MKKLLSLFILSSALSVTAKAAEFVTAHDGKIVRNYSGSCVVSWDTPNNVTIHGCDDKMDVVAVTPATVRDVPRAEPEARLATITAPKLTLVGSTFAVNNTKLNKSAQIKLDRLASDLKTTLGNGTIQIKGYADPMGSEAHNQELSHQRALATKEYLVKKGIPAKNIQAIGAGESKESACDFKNKSQMVQCFEKDRKVEIEVPTRKL